MATGDKYISFFSITSGVDRWAYYDYRVDEETNGDPKVRVGQIVQDGYPPAGGAMPTLPKDPRGYLDIEETRRRGYCTYAFQLNATVAGRPRLQFVPNDPFHRLPLNSTGKEDFLKDPPNEYGGKGLWASFSCNLDEVQDSGLAKRIKAQIASSAERPILRIPFCFNVIDPQLGASPWVVPGEQSDSNFAELAMFTHGGVHPAETVSLNVELE